MAEKSISKFKHRPPERVTNEKLLIGWEEIEKHFGGKYKRATLKRWMRVQGMPVARLPDRLPCTDPELIRRWLWLRWQARWGIKNLREGEGSDYES